MAGLAIMGLIFGLNGAWRTNSDKRAESVHAQSSQSSSTLKAVSSISRTSATSASVPSAAINENSGVYQADASGPFKIGDVMNVWVDGVVNAGAVIGINDDGSLQVLVNGNYIRVFTQSTK